MFVCVAGYKGGVGKTTTSAHVARYLQLHAPTLLIDGDPNRSVSRWKARGSGFPFAVLDQDEALPAIRRYDHVVTDTRAREDEQQLARLARGCDLLILPSTPDALAIDALALTMGALREVQTPYKVLLTMCPPPPQKDADEARELLAELGLPVFDAQIPQRKAFRLAALRGTTVDQLQDAGAVAAWEAYRQVGEEVLRGR